MSAEKSPNLNCDLLIKCDDRETSSNIPALLKESQLFEIAVSRLEIGDYVIGELVIERKTGQDLERSLADGRLFKQLALMKRSFFKRLLIIEGSLANAAISIQALRGLLTKISVGFQIPIISSANPAETALYIERAAVQLYGFGSSSYCIRPHKNPSAELRFQQLFLLVGLPGIGIKRAEQLLKHFGSVKAVLCADPEQIRTLSGMSLTHCQLMKQILTDELNEQN